MSDTSRLIISGAPHIHGPESVNKIMWGVVIALIPALLLSVYFFGFSALRITLASVAFCVGFEWLINKFLLRKPCSICDGSAVITGILLAFNVPSNLPIWMLMLGALAAIGIAKMAYGGLGNNPFNPALVGRVFLLISFPTAMTLWPSPQPLFGVEGVDAVTGPTVLGLLKEGLDKGLTISEIMPQLNSHLHLFLGFRGGSLGEVSAIALIIGGIFMLIRKIITWHIPVTFIGSAYIFAAILHIINPEMYVDPHFVILSGGIMLGAIFMATDMVTSPMTTWGKIVFGLGCGILTVLIRVFGAYPEGVSFAILIMNAFVPLINKGFRPKLYGY